MSWKDAVGEAFGGDEITSLLDDYEKSEDKEAFVRGLEEEMNKGEKKMENEKTENKELTSVPVVNATPDAPKPDGEKVAVENKTPCEHIAMIKARDEQIAALNTQIDAIKKPLVNKICENNKDVSAEKLTMLDVETLVALSVVKPEKKPAARHTLVEGDSTEKRGKTILF